jgi:hypothetical protein
MDFESIDADSCQYTAALDVAEHLRSELRELWRMQDERGKEIGGDLANVVLAGLTVVWLESVTAQWNTVYGESAMSLMRGLNPGDKEDKTDMKRAARDFLRRSNWWIKRRIK